jgi:hypothetical protein
MTLFVVFGLAAVVIGVLVAVVLGVRSMRAQERAGDDWDSPDTDSEFGHPDDVDRPVRRRDDRRRQGTRRPAGRGRPDDRGDDTGDDTGHRSRMARSGDDNPGYGPGPGYGTDPGFGNGYEGNGYEHAGTRATRTGGAARSGTDDGSGFDGPRAAAPGRRHLQKEQPRKRERPAGRDTPEGWKDTNWDRVSDEDYWAEMSADKPLASRTAQSAADLRSPDPEPVRKKRQARTDPNLAQPEPQTATMATAEFAARHQPGADQATREVSAPRDVPARDVPSLPVRRSGSTPAHGFAVPATTRPAPRAAAADYADPNLALLASLGEPAVEAAGQPSGSRRPAATEPSATPAGGWPAVESNWSQRGQEPAAAVGSPGGYHSAPPAPAAPAATSTPPGGYSLTPPGTYGGPSYGAQQPGGYGTDTPGYGLMGGPGYAAGNSYDTGPHPAPPASAVPSASSSGSAGYGGAASYGSASSYGSSPYGTASRGTSSYGAAYDMGAGQFGGHADLGLPASSYGTHAAGSSGASYDTGSFGKADTMAYGTAGPASYAPAPETTGVRGDSAHGGGPYHDPYDHRNGQAAPGAGWGAAASGGGRFAGDGWQPSGQTDTGRHLGGGPSATPMTGYGAPVTDNYQAAIPAIPPGTPAGGMPRAGGSTTDSYQSPPPAGGFASGYLSSSTLSARHGRPEPEPLTSPSSANPYGSYISDPPAAAPDERDTGTVARRRPRHSSANGYDDQRSFGGYGDYGGGSRH